MRGKWILIAGIAAVLAAGGAAYWQLGRQAPAKPAAAPKGLAELPAGAEVSLQGTLRAKNVVVVKASIDGVLEEFPVAPGDEVFEGQILGRVTNDALKQNDHNATQELERVQARVNALESGLIAARLEESRASADAARARAEEQMAERVYNRQQLLWKEGATPRKTFDTAEKNYLTAKTEAATLTALARQVMERVEQAGRDLEAAKKLLGEAEAQASKAHDDLAAEEIHSPVDGLVLTIKKQAGEEVKKDAGELIEIGVDLTAMEVALEPEPRIQKRLAQGMPALIQIAELPGDGVPGTVTKVGDGKAVVEFASPSPLIRPGISAVVRLKLP